MDDEASPSPGGAARSRRAAARPEIRDSYGDVRVGQAGVGPLGLPLAGGRVDQCCLDHAFSLKFDVAGRSWVLRIEADFEMSQAGGKTQHFGDASPGAWGPAVDALLHHAVSAAGVDAGGTLELLFEGDRRVVVAPDIQFEAWQLSGPDGELIVSAPGGELAIWAARPNTDPHHS